MPETSGPLVREHTERGIRTLILDSPGNRNALSARLRTELAAGIGRAVADEHVRAVVITGTGPAFCSGADLKEVAAERAGTPSDPDAPGMPDLFGAIMDAPKPVVARLNGSARAGGIGLVAASDIAIAPLSATFAFTEVRIGVVPAIISVPVGARMADRQLSRYFLTGEIFRAATAAEAGLLTLAVPDGEVPAATERILDSLRRCAPAALARTKALLVDRAHPRDRAAAFAEMGEISREFFASDDAAEGRAAFFAKRPARWVIQ